MASLSSGHMGPHLGLFGALQGDVSAPQKALKLALVVFHEQH